jgi:phospholipid/cholesterol/gamma-HCH transport system substrate-binding protein
VNLKGLTAPLIKSLVFAFVTVAATALLALSIADTNVGSTTAYRARFTDASGLRSGDSVRIAGVVVGHVDGISVVDHRVALVKFSVQKDHPLPASATAAIRYVNLVGQRYLALDQGGGEVGTLARGATIPVERTSPALNLTQLFNGFQPLFQALSPNDVNQLAGELVQVFQGEGGTVAGLVDTLGSLTSTLASKDKVIGQLIDNLSSVVGTVNARSGELSSLITTLQQLVSGLSTDRKPIGDAISAMDSLTNSTAGLLYDVQHDKSGQDPLKNDIIQLGRLSANLNDDKPVVDKFLRTLPLKLSAISRLGSYGSWLNFNMCRVVLGPKGSVTYKTYPSEPPRPDPSGVPLTAERCKG